MNEFNFYINVDECLNMSNFEMFFYKLQNEDRFYVAEASSNDGAGKGEGVSGTQSIQAALYGIKNYIGQSSVMIHDYRLIFGVRQIYKKTVPWKETVLYRLLKIHYCMQNARLFIKTKDRADKNVTVILLYDVENTMDERNIQDEITDNTQDIPALMDYLGVDWGISGATASEKDIVEAMLASTKKSRDEITIQFVKDFHNWYINNKMYEIEENNEAEEILVSPNRAPNRSEDESKTIQRFNNIHNLVSFIDSIVGGYCVFTKAISNNTGDHRLALLGIVDYITTGLASDLQKDDEYHSNETLKSIARSNWKNAKNDKTIWKKYGAMMRQYEARMQTQQRRMSGRTPTSGEELIYETSSPGRLICEYNGTEYEERITGVIDEFLNGLSFWNGGKSWESTEKDLKDRLGMLEITLEKYTDSLSSMYRQEISRRNEEKKRRIEDKKLYNTERIDELIQNVQRKKTGLLENLKQQKMTPHIQYQDQLNVDNAIRGCSRKVNYYQGRQEYITLANFFLLLFSAGGFVLASHLLLQESLIQNSTNLLGVGLSVLIGFVFMMFAWGAPALYYRKETRKAVEQLRKELIVFTHGYSEIAGNFEEYMNTINAIDVMNGYLEELSEIRSRCHSENRKYLWHKEAISRHLQKCEFFRLLYDRGSSSPENDDLDIKLMLETDVIHNPFYWPQQGMGGNV